eukprot:Rhum_TRINITY_DN9675_c0_g1::Rhum_TRINITY_DN9675_c0_g1_i1::g.34673::m.34673
MPAHDVQALAPPTLNGEGAPATSADAATPPPDAAPGTPPPLIHSVSMADFDITIGNTLSQTWPKGVDLKKEIVQQNMNDMCFPDGAHDAHRDTVCAVVDRREGGHLYAVGCYRGIKSGSVKRGAIQRGVLIVTTAPLFGSLAEYVHNLLRWWLCSGTEQTNPINPHMLGAQAGAQGGDSPLASPSDEDRDATTWVDVTAHLSTHGLLESTPRFPSPDEDSSFLSALYTSLQEGFEQTRDNDRNMTVPVSFKMTVKVPAAAPAAGAAAAAPAPATVERVIRYSTELYAPCASPLSTIGDQLSFGCCVSKLVRIFKSDVAKIYTALLDRRTLCFVDQGNAAEVCMCVLACCHLVRPMQLDPSIIIPYFTVTDARKVESQGFCVAGSTNPFFEDPTRNKWAAAICNISTGTVVLTANQATSQSDAGSPFSPPVPSSPVSPFASATCVTSLTHSHVRRQAERLTSHIVQGVLMEEQTEAWVRNFFEWSNAKILKGLLQDGKTLPLMEGCPELTADRLDKAVADTEAITVTVTKCHEVNKRKTKIHSDWFRTIIDVLKPASQRSEAEAKDMYSQIAAVCLDDALSGFRDVTVNSCGSRTERAAVAQLTYEESKTRMLVTELRERIHLLIDSINSPRNTRAFQFEENQLFCDTFNTPDYQFYNFPSQVLLLSTSCVVENRTITQHAPTTNANAHSAADVGGGGADNQSFYQSETPTASVTKCSGKIYVSKNYLCFVAGWRSRVGKSTKGDRVVSPIEVVPFDMVERVDAETQIVSDGIRLTLTPPSGDVNTSVTLLITNISGDTYKVLTLLETLCEKQRRMQMMIGALDPVLNVPDLCDGYVVSPIGVERRVHIPCGMYLYERLVTEEVYELMRFYPVAGWRSKLLPTDPPQFCDRSGKYDRRMQEGSRHTVTLPEGWVWLNEWSHAGWEYNTDMKSKPYSWSSTHSKLDIVRRRRWTRVRRLDVDALGTPLPVMMLPTDYPVQKGLVESNNEEVVSSPLGGGKGARAKEEEAAAAEKAAEAASAAGEARPGEPEAASAATDSSGRLPVCMESFGILSASFPDSQQKNCDDDDEEDDPEISDALSGGGATGGDASPAPPSDASPAPAAAAAAEAASTSPSPQHAVRCRQSVSAGRSSRPGLTPAAFHPDTVLRTCGAELGGLGLDDFETAAVPVAGAAVAAEGRFSPFHASSALPGCGASRVATSLPGNPRTEGERLQIPVDELIAEANGISPAAPPAGSGSRRRTTATPQLSPGQVPNSSFLASPAGMAGSGSGNSGGPPGNTSFAVASSSFAAVGGGSASASGGGNESLGSMTGAATTGTTAASPLSFGSECSGSPQGGEASAAAAASLSSSPLSKSDAKRRERRQTVRKFKEDFKTDLRGLKESFCEASGLLDSKEDRSGTAVSRGVVLVDAAELSGGARTPVSSAGGGGVGVCGSGGGGGNNSFSPHTAAAVLPAATTPAPAAAAATSQDSATVSLPTSPVEAAAAAAPVVRHTTPPPLASSRSPRGAPVEPPVAATPHADPSVAAALVAAMPAAAAVADKGEGAEGSGVGRPPQETPPPPSPSSTTASERTRRRDVLKKGFKNLIRKKDKSDKSKQQSQFSDSEL